MKEYLEKVDYSIQENKHKMNDLFEMAMCSVEKHEPKLYDHIKTELHEIVYGKKINDYMAKCWVENMKPMAKWTKEQVASVLSSYNISIPINCAYVLFNMMYSDNSRVLGSGDDEESLKKYIQAVKDWYFDEDLTIPGEEKLYNYYKYIVKATK